MALNLQQTFSGMATISTEYGSASIGQQDYSDLFYVKVESIRGDKNQQTAEVSFYLNESKFVSRQYCFLVDIEGANFIKQAYLHLKTLPEFTDAVDC
jgi:hypothetical protein